MNLKPSMREIAIGIENLYFKYSDQVLFHNFNLQIHVGEKVWLSSPSGRGKSTLLRLIFGFENYKGKITVSGSTVKLNQNQNKNQMAYIPPSLEVAESKISAYGLIENIKNFKVNANKKENYNEKKISHFAGLLELGQVSLKQNFSDLSKGEKQRVLILIALLSQKQILIADEPVSGLPNKQKEYILNLLQEHYATILLISHDHVKAFKKVVI